MSAPVWPFCPRAESVQANVRQRYDHSADPVPEELHQQDRCPQQRTLGLAGQHLVARLVGIHGVALSGKVGRDGTEGPGTLGMPPQHIHTLLLLIITCYITVLLAVVADPL